MADLTTIFHHLQRQLFPALTDELGSLSPLDQQFCEVISLTDLGRFTRRYEWCGNGCPPCPRTWLAHAFIAKCVYQFPTTSALIDALQARPLLRQLCGRESAGDIPREPTFSRALGHVPIIDPNPRGGEKLPCAPAQAQRFKERSASERVNSLLKERYGGRWVRGRGAAKVMCHLMFGLVARTATALFARLC
jgi:Transposase domain (DUF772)